MKHDSIFSLSRLKGFVKDKTVYKGTLMSYINHDIRKRLKSGETEIAISLINTPYSSEKSLLDYLSEYHGNDNKYNIELLRKLFYFIYDSVHYEFYRYNDLEVSVEVLNGFMQKIKVIKSNVKKDSNDGTKEVQEHFKVQRFTTPYDEWGNSNLGKD